MGETNKTELRLLKDTGSPSGRYAVAWGVPGVSRLDQFTLDTFPDDRVRNFLVEKQRLRIVGTLPLHSRGCNNAGGGCNYKEGGDDWHGLHNSMRNHSHISTFWDASEQWAVVLHSGKWWYNAIYLCHRQAGQFKIIEIGDKVEDLVRAHLLKTRRIIYQQIHHLDERLPCVDVSELNLAPPLISLDVSAGIPKRDPDPLGFRGRLELKIHQHLGGFSVSAVHLKPIKY